MLTFLLLGGPRKSETTSGSEGFSGFPPTWKVRESQGIWVVRESQGKVREFWMESGKKNKRRKNAK